MHEGRKCFNFCFLKDWRKENVSWAVLWNSLLRLSNLGYFGSWWLICLYTVLRATVLSFCPCFLRLWSYQLEFSGIETHPHLHCLEGDYQTISQFISKEVFIFFAKWWGALPLLFRKCISVLYYRKMKIALWKDKINSWGLLI